MHLTPIQLRAALAEALATLEAAGVPSTHVVLGFTNSPRDGEDTAYESHVGPTRDYGVAGLLSMLAAELSEEARAASVALIRGEQCPSCGSPRWRFRQRRRRQRRHEKPGVYVETFDECMDCGVRGPAR